jgi:hypothetical protein
VSDIHDRRSTSKATLFVSSGFLLSRRACPRNQSPGLLAVMEAEILAEIGEIIQSDGLLDGDKD